MLPELTQEQWLLGILGAMCMGLGKGGLTGMGNIAIWLYAEAFGAKASVGILLPVLICADTVALAVYHRHANWRHLVRLLPLLVLGTIIGYFLFEHIPSSSFRPMMGGFLLGLTAIHFLRKYLVERRKKDNAPEPEYSQWLLWGTGILGGVSTMLANAAGPIISFYLMAAKMPKYVFLGTGAWIYILINGIKVPLQMSANNLDASGLRIGMTFGVVAIAFACIAPLIVRYIPQKLFEKLVWTVILIAALRLML